MAELGWGIVGEREKKIPLPFSHFNSVESFRGIGFGSG